LVQGLAPQIDRRDLRRVLEGNLEPHWPKAPTWVELTQSISS
ncbi:CysB family transcriptional regulator, partial [Salinisphaera sp. USBA-960]|nr:CysB family transcriptional regulator [Salifodinibacter halophilus]